MRSLRVFVLLRLARVLRVPIDVHTDYFTKGMSVLKSAA